MLACDETATLVRHTEEGDEDVYICVPLRGVSWFAKVGVAVTADGVKPVNTLRVRIPDGVLPEDVTPRAGDLMVRGVLEKLERPSELEGRSYFVVTAVGDDRRGNLPHWSVSGA